MATERKGAGEEEVGFRKGFSQGAGGFKENEELGAVSGDQGSRER